MLSCRLSERVLQSCIFLSHMLLSVLQNKGAFLPGSNGFSKGLKDIEGVWMSCRTGTEGSRPVCLKTRGEVEGGEKGGWINVQTLETLLQGQGCIFFAGILPTHCGVLSRTMGKPPKGSGSSIWRLSQSLSELL